MSKRREEIERRLGIPEEEKERAVEAGITRSILTVTEDGRKILRIRWVTGKTSAGRFFGRYGREGRPDFFRLLFGAIAGSLREHFGPEESEKIFSELRDKPEYKTSVRQVFDEMKSWFFNEIVPKYKIEPGDIFVIVTDLELDLTTGKLTWFRDRSEVIYWIRSDKLQEVLEELKKGAAPPTEVGELRRKVEELSTRVRELEAENSELKRKIEELMRENSELRSQLADYIARGAEASELKTKMDELSKQLEEARSEAERLREELKKVTEERDELRRRVEELTKENDSLKNELDKLRSYVSKLEKSLGELKKVLEEVK
ncbi:MAG: hypothetical protein DRJ40_05955 [Thermoprotei archaeon]|nr:MAG: hypothetical protein DRJ40_05955 [Thermoprotei archaeon]